MLTKGHIEYIRLAAKDGLSFLQIAIMDVSEKANIPTKTVMAQYIIQTTTQCN